MKTKRIELDVDFIGSQSAALTVEEGKAISEYIRSNNAKMGRKSSKKKVKM